MTVHDHRQAGYTGPAPHRPRSRASQAAALVWRESAHGLQVLLVTSLTTGRWVLPKGWCEKGEDGATAALREAFEEAGVNGIAAPGPLGVYIYDKRKRTGKIDAVDAEVFAVEATGAGEHWPEQHRRRRVWASPQAAATMVEEPDLARIIREFGRDFHRRA